MSCDNSLHFCVALYEKLLLKKLVFGLGKESLTLLFLQLALALTTGNVKADRYRQVDATNPVSRVLSMLRVYAPCAIVDCAYCSVFNLSTKQHHKYSMKGRVTVLEPVTRVPCGLVKLHKYFIVEIKSQCDVLIRFGSILASPQR